MMIIVIILSVGVRKESESDLLKGGHLETVKGGHHSCVCVCVRQQEHYTPARALNHAPGEVSNPESQGKRAGDLLFVKSHSDLCV
jgi:hypothetical protein